MEIFPLLMLIFKRYILDTVAQLNEHTNTGKVKQGMLAICIDLSYALMLLDTTFIRS